MKIILTEDQYEQLTEMIKLDIKVGDTIMGGKFKNKKVVVKTIGKNDKGDITINGKPLLRFRIIKESASNDIEKRYKTYSKLLNELTETFDWVSKIDVKISSTEAAGGWRNEDSKPLLKVSVYFKNYQKIRMTTQFELFDEISFIHDMFFPHLTGDPHIYSDHSDNVTAYFSVKSVFPNGKTDSFPSQNQIVSGDYDAVSQINESNDKNKKFLISVMGMDFTDKIKQITSTYDVPTSFDDGIAPSTIRTYLNFWGPMYLVNIDGKNYLYQDRGDFEMFIDEDGYWNKDEIPEKLGIGVMGLRFSDILDMYFEEEDHR
jgi:hypothetical protein